MLKIAIVGMGGIGNTHARCYQANPNTEIVAVCDIIQERADNAATAYGAKAYYTVKDMLAARAAGEIQFDAASMCTAGKENGGDHYTPTMELLGAGVPTLGEKPISNEIDKAKEMVALGKEKNVPYAVDLNHRFTPSAIRAKEWLDAGRLGELNILNMTMWINNPNETSEHFHMRALHPHSLDICRYFGGDVKKVQAFFKRGPGRICWSNVHVNLLFESGLIGHLTGSYDAGGSYGLETCELVGSKARVIINEACEKLCFYPRENNQIEVFEHLGGMQGFPDTFGSRIGAWVDDLMNKVEPCKINGKGEDALKVQLIIEAAIESWNTGQVITL